MAADTTTLPVLANPFGGSGAMAPVPTSALAHTDAQRAVAEVQAALVIARMNPRDPRRAMDLILQDCTRHGLAERAIYAYARGGSDISGPSIRLAETIAQRWGNMQYGVRELEQRDGESVMQAYAWDVETNTRREVTFTVPHARDTKHGRTVLKDARDIYEATANVGARRLRACILGILPGDVVEAAQRQCELTMRAKADVTPERITQLVDYFASYGVTRDMIERRIQRRLEAVTPALLLQLGKIANSLRDGMSSPSDWFEAVPTVREVQRSRPTEPTAPAAAIEETTVVAPPTDAEPVTKSANPTPAVPPSRGPQHTPDRLYTITEIQRPNTAKDYIVFLTAEGVTFHAWSKAVQNEVTAAHVARIRVRVTAELVDFKAAPWKATAIQPDFKGNATTDREPGAEG